MTSVARGDTITLTAYYRLSTGTLVDPVNPRADIIDPFNVEVVTDAVPTRQSLGIYTYDYLVDAGAPLGGWTIHWTGTIGGNLIADDDVFTVVDLGSISFPPTSSGPIVTAWATELDLCAPCNDYAIDTSLMDEYLFSATEILYELSAKQFPGILTETIRPCSNHSAFTLGLFPSSSPGSIIRGETALLDWSSPGFVRPFAACGCGSFDACSCSFLQTLELPRLPYAIVDVIEVKVDGVILASSSYRVDDFRFLTRTDGNPWPIFQDLSLPDTSPNTFSVTYTYGRNPPMIGVKASAVLACELYMACNPDDFQGLCRLPRNITSVARQGVSIVTANAQELFVTRAGQPARFGIWEIDMFLRAFNPHGLSAPTVVLSPDLPPSGKRVGTNP